VVGLFSDPFALVAAWASLSALLPAPCSFALLHPLSSPLLSLPSLSFVRYCGPQVRVVWNVGGEPEFGAALVSASKAWWILPLRMVFEPLRSAPFFLYPSRRPSLQALA